MKNFNYIAETGTVGAEDYGERKRRAVLETIKPICAAFEITDYDYTVGDHQELLTVEGQEIDCTRNSIGATVKELINYIKEALNA